MSHVVRRKRPRHDGSRYFNNRGPCAHECASGATYDTAEEADSARRNLREPHLWEAMQTTEAVALDKGETEAFATKMREPVPSLRRAISMFVFGAASGHGIKL